MKSLTIFDRQYFVDENGNVFNQEMRKLTQHIDKYGYKYIVFRRRRNGKVERKKFLLHRLVAKLFIDNPNNLPQINHLDGNKQNNCIQNLEWTDSSGNQTHSRYVLKNQTGFADTPVRCVESNQTFISTRAAWRETGVSYCHISECVNGKRKTAGGFHWEKC